MREAFKSGAMALVGSALSIMAAAHGSSPIERQVMALLSMLLAADCVVEAFGILDFTARAGTTEGE